MKSICKCFFFFSICCYYWTFYMLFFLIRWKFDSAPAILVLSLVCGAATTTTSNSASGQSVQLPRRPPSDPKPPSFLSTSSPISVFISECLNTTLLHHPWEKWHFMRQSDLSTNPPFGFRLIASTRPFLKEAPDFSKAHWATLGLFLNESHRDMDGCLRLPFHLKLPPSTAHRFPSTPASPTAPTNPWSVEGN